MQVMQLTNKVVKSMWMFIASALVVLAVLLTCVRLLLPSLTSYNQAISGYLESNYDLDIQFGHIQAGWHGNGPTLQLVDVDFIQKEDEAIDVELASLNIEIDFWRSLYQREIVADNFVLDGVVLDINSALLKRQDEQPAEQSDDITESLSPLLLKHIKRFDVTNSRLNFIKPNGKLTKLNIEKLSWNNRGTRHQGVGAFSFAALDAESVKFILDLHGTEMADLSGQLYVNSMGVNLAGLLAAFSDDAVSDIYSHVPFQAWLTIKDGMPETFTGHIQPKELHQHIAKPNQISWFSEGKSHSLAVDGGQVYGRYDELGWRFTLNDLILGSGDEFSHLNIDWVKKYDRSTIKVKPTELKALLSLANLVDLPENVQDMLESVDQDMRLSYLSAELDNHKQFKLLAGLDNIGWQAVGDIPGLDNWNLTVAVNNQTAIANVASKSGQLSLPSLYDKPFDIEFAKTQVIANWNQVGELTPAWSIKVRALEAQLPQTELLAEAFIAPNEFNEVAMQMFAEVGKNSAENIEPFLPRKAMGQDVYDYVVGALKGGYAKHAQALWQGAFTHYPYTDKQGVFLADINIEEGVFKFQPDWPVATDLALKLSFVNDGLFFYSEQATLLDAELVKLDASIEELIGEADLKLYADIKATGQAATEVMQASMLADSVGAALSEIRISGDIQANLQLLVPLASDNELSVKGHVDFAQNPINIKAPDFNFTQVTGRLHYDMDKLNADGITFSWGHAPFKTDVTAQQTVDGYKIKLDLGSSWQAQPLIKDYLFSNMAGRTKGQIDWQGELLMTIPKDGFNYEFTGEFDLAEVELDLPEPYFKPVGQAKRLVLTADGDDKVTRVHAHIGKNLKFDGVIPYEQSRFTRAYLVLGEEQLGAPGQGFNIAIHQDKMVVDDYISFVNDLVADIKAQPTNPDDADKPPILSKPRRVRGQVEAVELGPLVWGATDFNIRSNEDIWLLKLTSPEFRGQLEVSEDWMGQGVVVDADYFNVTPKPASTEKSTKEQELEVAQAIYDQLPPVTFDCQRCEWETLPLGSIALNVSRDNNQVQVNDFRLKYKKNVVEGNGEWILENGQNKTSTVGTVKSDDIGAWARSYDFTSPVKDSNFESNFELSWQSTPYNLDLVSLNGELKGKLGEGHLSEVSDKGARVFSVLSLDSLVRKLRLDFRDVFNKGLFYNSMQGTMQVNNGVVSTQDTVMNAIAGNMNIQGQTNLTTQAINYNISFAPKVTSSIPLIVAWMVNPVAGVAALAIDKTLESAEVISKLEFKITGTIYEPLIDETGRVSREVQLSGEESPTMKSVPTLDTAPPEQPFDQLPLPPDSEI
ncbi:TIGR02099 family protein [Catenovulum sp. SM1970]|uniref:YhdP family protein n=1 Tax=Marinifaba aquimaris TaxID=2741323 RepID=UPI001574B957|nr:YhdP family protein [Marinifaba aquimaris]NTS75877.1 TIGR02099 family protein [Marinifaba aquimaris]